MYGIVIQRPARQNAPDWLWESEARMAPLQLLVLILEWVLVGIVAFIIYLIISMLMAMVRNYVALGFINNLFVIFGVLFGVLNNIGRWFATQLDQLMVWGWQGLKHAWERAGEMTIANNLGALDVLTASGFFILFLILVASDAYFAALRLPALFGVNPPNLNPNLFTPVTVFYWVSMIVVIAATCADAWGLTHLLPPYTGAKGSLRKTMRVVATVAAAILLLAGILQGIFSWELVSGVSIPIVDSSLNALLFMLGFIATAAVGIAVQYEALGLLVIIPGLLRLIPAFLARLLDFPLNLLNTCAMVAVSLYDALAIMGFHFWNWISDVMGRSKSTWKVGRMAEFERRKSISEDTRFTVV